ncbi:hypothetical protein [Streptomyces canus]|uniref:hypothetical protein n=1 Tax=Streptomyces canus TaxID=58343 RepID=UPI0022512464|nr:hypothetical protein [Streptomyces canus]MCX4856645.1 hypothetical protein [Streptomyces canus]
MSGIFSDGDEVSRTPWSARRAVDIYTSTVRAKKEMTHQLRVVRKMAERYGTRASEAVEAVMDGVEQRIKFLKIIAEGDPAVDRLLHSVEVEAAWLRRAIDVWGEAA